MLGAMHLSRRARYALCGIFDIAYNGGEAPVPVRAVCARQKVPLRYLEQVFQDLRRAGLLRSKRGPGGGYLLTRPAERITVRQVIEAVQGPLGRTLAPPARAGRGKAGRPDFLMVDLVRRVEHSLDGLSLADLCRRAAKAGAERASAENRTWHI